MYKEKKLSGWGNYPSFFCKIYRPERSSHVKNVFKKHKGKIIARGAGCAYGDAALQEKGVVVSGRMDKFLLFDENEGILKVQSGVTIKQVLELIVPKGWFLPVVPGTMHATIGGCVACNVHGKNNYNSGEFSRHIKSIKLITVSGKEIECSMRKNSDVFWASCAGYGMTGFIDEVTLKLRKIDSASLAVFSAYASDIELMISLFRHNASNSDYMVGFVDGFAKNAKLGRGIFTSANHISVRQKGVDVTDFSLAPAKISIPLYMPSWLLNFVTVSLVIKIFIFFSNMFSSRKRIKSLASFFFVLDRVGNWNRLYGHKGMLQYQIILPDKKYIAADIKTILKKTHAFGCPSFLTVIKYHGRHSGLLSFSMPGFSLAMDFPNCKKAHVLIAELNKIVLELGGRVYLAKDTDLTPDIFRKMYVQHLEKWRSILNKLDPKGCLGSMLSKRVLFRGA